MPSDKESIFESGDIARGLHDIAKSIRLLGYGNIDRGENAHGAVEQLVMAIKESTNDIGDALDGVSASIRELARAVHDSR